MGLEIPKYTLGEQPVEDILNFTCIYVYLCMYLFVLRLLAKQKTSYDTDLKFGTHTPIDLI